MWCAVTLCYIFPAPMLTAADASSTLLGMKSSAGMADFTWEATTALMETTSGTAGLGSASTMAEPSGMQTQSAITMDTTVFVAPSTQVEVFSAPGSMMSTSVESVSTTLEPSSIPTEPSIAPGSVRLVDGTGPHEGRVEIFYNDTWGTVCDNNWSLNDGLVVCRQLGYPGVLRVYKGAHFGEGTGPILFDNLICKGTEDNLTQCPNGEVNCDHSEDAGVTCARETVSPSSTIATKGPTANSSVLPLATSILSSTLMEMTSAPMVVTSTMLEPSNIPTEPSPASGSVRLVDGTGPHEGRVEIFYNDTWGTVCDNNWSLNDGLVVCRQLGYPGVLRVYKRAHFGEGTGPILFDNLICKGTEDNLTQCPNGEVNCDHSEDAGVTCARETVSPSSTIATKGPTANSSVLPLATSILSSTLMEMTSAPMVVTSTMLEPSNIPTEPSPASGSVRLVDGTGPHEGRVEIFYNDTWGTVCDNNWSLNDGLVVCRQLGYPGVLRVYKRAHFGEGTGPILFDNLICKGTEDNLTQCPNGEVNCDHSEDAGVTCARESVSSSSMVKEPTASTSALPSPDFMLPSTQDVQSTLTVVTPSIPIATPVITPSTSVITSTPPVTDSTTAAATPSSTTASTQPSTSPTPVNVQTPTGVTVSTPPVTDGAVRITLMWSKPGSDSGLTGYQIQYSWESKWDPSRFVKRQSERKTMSVTVTDASYTLQDVEGFAEYCFAVSALYEGGDESPATAEQCTTTPETSECMWDS